MRLYDYAASGNCYKVRLLLALLGQPYERVPVDIFAGETLTAEYAALNPARETPVLVLDDGAVLTQSNAILWYLAEGTPLLPDGRLARARVLQWLLFELEYVSGIAGARFRTLTGRGESAAIEARAAQGREGLAALDRELGSRPFLVDRLSIADLAIYAYTHVARDAGIELAGYRHVQRWLARIEAEPGFVDDFVPYPPNARPGAGASIYD